MTKMPLMQFISVQDDLLFWIKQYIASKIYAIKSNKPIGDTGKKDLNTKILNAQNINELNKYVLNAKSYGLNNLYGYSNPLYKFYIYIGDKENIFNIKDIDILFLNKYTKDVLFSYTTKTQTMHYNQILSLFKFISNNNREGYSFGIGLSKGDIKTKSPINKNKTKDIKYLTPKQLVDFFKSLRGVGFNDPNKFQPMVIIKFLCFGGLSKEELINIRIKDIEKVEKENKLYLKISTHLKREKNIYIQYALIENDYNLFLNKRIMHSSSEYLFITRNKKPYASQTITNLVRRIFIATKLHVSGTQYDLHKSFIVYLHIIEGLPLDNIAKLLDYSPKKIAEIYAFLLSNHTIKKEVLEAKIENI